MTIAKDFASKFAVAFVAVAMIFMAIAPSVKAADSSADLQKTINDLLAQVAALQSQMGGTPTPAGLACGVFSMDLKMGSNGADVKNLQVFLNSNADTMVAAAGAGSKGMETMTFGPLTATAVSKFQVKYRAEILTPAGLVNGTGYFGPGSRAQANKLCAGAPTPTPGGTPTPGSTDLSGEASLDKFSVDSPADGTIEEGAEDAPVAEITAKFQDGDASISRLDVSFNPAGTRKPWDILDSVAVFVDGEQVGDSVNASDRHDYIDETNGTLRLTGLDIVAMEDKDADITVVATLQDGLDTADQVNVVVTVDAMRYFDASGVATTEDGVIVTSDSSNFDVEAAGAQDELIAKTSTEDPNSTTLELKDDAKSAWIDVFAFDLDTKDSTNDITINTIKVNVLTTIASYDSLVDKAELEIDGTTYDDVSGGNAAIGNAVLTFDTNGDAVINAGDRVTAVLKLRFKSLPTLSEGATVKGSITSLSESIVDAEGTDTLTDADSQLSGSATGDVHTLRTTGISTEMTSDDAVVTVGQNAGDDYATYTLKVDVTAFNQDVYLSTNAATSTGWSLVDGAGATVTGGTRTVTLTSTADEDTVGFFHISEGDTKTLTLKVTFDPTATNVAARLQLNSLKFDDNGTVSQANDKTQTTLPATDYRTEVVTIVN